MEELTRTITMTTEEVALVREELQRLRDENARMGVKEPRDKAFWAKETNDMRQRYKRQKRPSRASEALLVIWALLWYGIDKAYRRLSAINKSEAWDG